LSHKTIITIFGRKSCYVANKRTMPIKHWGQAMQAFSIIFEGRVPTLDGNSFTQIV
jgi:hypothetical protein